jgi:hypothetical protein
VCYYFQGSDNVGFMGVRHMGMHPLVAWSKAVAFNEDGQPLATGERA